MSGALQLQLDLAEKCIDSKSKSLLVLVFSLSDAWEMHPQPQVAISPRGESQRLEQEVYILVFNMLSSLDILLIFDESGGQKWIHKLGFTVGRREPRVAVFYVGQFQAPQPATVRTRVTEARS